MMRAAGADLTDFHGKVAKECIPILRKGIETLKSDPKRFKTMNPENGWGDYDGLVECLETILSYMEKLPEGIVTVT